MLNARGLIGSHDVLFVTLDALRYDVAVDALARGLTPNLGALLPGGRWEMRHTPATFTYPAHQAFFAGFLPTPARPGRHARLFAARFEGSATTGPLTWVFEAPDLVTALSQRGYRTICIGGVGFFNRRSSLGAALPGLFDESHWSPRLGVRDRQSTAHQVSRALDALALVPEQRRVFLFVNVSATHPPTSIFLEGAHRESVESQAAALAHADRHLGDLFEALRRRGPLLAIICSDHGTAFGEDGYVGHRLAHPVVWTVPYAEVVLPAAAA